MLPDHRTKGYCRVNISKRMGDFALSFFKSTATALAFGLFSFSAAPASAATFILDFDTPAKTDIFSETTGFFDHTAFGFSAGISRVDVISGVLNAVKDHFLGYVTSDVDASSPLAPGYELDIDFAVGTVGSPPAGTDFWYMGIGPDANGPSTLFGQACLDCVRDASGAANKFALPVGSIVGSIFTNSIATAAGLATNDQQLINLIAGTTSHEIGHALSLFHAGAKDSNPGASAWGVMGSGATAMPTIERTLEREFTYAKFDQLIGAVGVRKVADAPAPIPLPASIVFLAFGLGALRLGARKGRTAALA
ncbi:hypothetical protein [Antarctobacter jejuensis]|uniref:hypothetical protein n=1 Tax=Antarctobacter jejuensis TaxID=1439938 RepID=UPI003FCF4C43